MKNGKPVLCVIGHGRAGKDSCCEFLRDTTTLTFLGGSSWTAREYMAKRLSEDEGHLITPDQAYLRRHEDRMKWFNYLNEWREDDPTILIKKILEHSDIVCGLRDRPEVLKGREAGLIDLVLWIENPRVPPDPTVTFFKEDADVIVLNEASLEVFYSRLRRLAKSMSLLKEGH